MEAIMQPQKLQVGFMRAVALAACFFALTAAWSLSSKAQTRPPAAPTWSPSGQLERPADYREWVYLTSGLGMTYGPAQVAAGQHQMFDNVFVTPEAYREFLESGTWPDKTMFILEMRDAQTNVSINSGGRTQGGVMGIEASVKDRAR